MTLEALAFVLFYIIVACVIALAMTKAVPPHGWYERVSTISVGIVWPLAAIMAVIMFLQMLDEDARRHRRLRREGEEVQRAPCGNSEHCPDHGLEEFDGCLGCASAAAIRRHRASEITGKAT